MGLRRRNAVLLVLVLALGVANLALVRTPRARTGAAPLFPALTPDAAARIVVTAPDGGTVTLARGEDGTWTVAERFGWRAYQPAVEAFLRGLAAATTSEREAVSPSSHAALGVDDATGNHLRVEDATGKVLAEAVQGAPPAGGRGSRLLPAGQDAVYRAPLTPRIVPDPSRCIDGQVVPVDAAAVATFSITLAGADGHAAAPVTYTREDDGRWRVGAGPGTVPPAAVDPFLQAFTGLVARDVVADPRPAGSALPAPAVSVTLTPGTAADGSGPEGEEVRIEVGWEDALGLEPLAGGSERVRVSFEGAPEGGWWFAVPVGGARRLVGLATRLGK